MKKILTTILAILMAYSPALAGLTPIDQAQFPFKNILVNPGFENGSYGWTASGGATKTANSTAKGIGSYGYDWDSNGVAQTLLSDAVIIPEALKGKNGLAYCSIKTPSGTATHTITVNDGSSDLATASTITSSTSFARVNVSFIFPSSGSVKIKLASVNANEPEIYIDDCFLGDASGTVFSTVIDTDWVSWTPTGSWSTNTTYSGKKRRVGDHAEYEVTISLSGAPTAANLTINLPSGEVIDTNKLTDTTAGLAHLGTGWILDSGTINYGLAQVSYNNTTSVLVRYSNASATATGTNLLSVSNTAPMTFASGDKITLKFSVPISGWSTSTSIYNAAVQNWKVDANISGANPSLGTSSVSSYTGIENGSLTLTNNTGSGNIAAQIPCSSTNSPSGTTCSAGSESVGVSFNLPAAGDVMACASFGHNIQTDQTTDVINATFQIVETPSNAQTISQEGKTRVGSGNTASSSNTYDVTFPHRVCGTFTFSSAGQKTLRLMYEQSVSGTPLASAIQADASTSNGQRDVHFEVYPINQQMPAPILVGSVTSNLTGSARVESASINCDASASVIRQTGSWISAVANAVDGGAYRSCTLTFASGMFSVAPSCVATNAQGAAGGALPVQTTSGYNTTTSLIVSGPDSDFDFSVICMGPK